MVINITKICISCWALLSMIFFGRGDSIWKLKQKCHCIDKKGKLGEKVWWIQKHTGLMTNLMKKKLVLKMWQNIILKCFPYISNWNNEKIFRYPILSEDFHNFLHEWQRLKIIINTKIKFMSMKWIKLLEMKEDKIKIVTHAASQL